MEMPRISLYIGTFFLSIPVLVSAYLGVYLGTFLSFVLLVSIIIFFGFHNKMFLREDYAWTAVTIFYSVYLLYLANFPAFSIALFLILILSGLYFLYEGRRTDFDDYHGIWHVCIALATTASYVGYYLMTAFLR